MQLLVFAFTTVWLSLWINNIVFVSVELTQRSQSDAYDHNSIHEAQLQVMNSIDTDSVNNL